jgi:hypothetical protein
MYANNCHNVIPHIVHALCTLRPWTVSLHDMAQGTHLSHFTVWKTFGWFGLAWALRVVAIGLALVPWVSVDGPGPNGYG